jgi:hypothetical protein
MVDPGRLKPWRKWKSFGRPSKPSAKPEHRWLKKGLGTLGSSDEGFLKQKSAGNDLDLKFK